MSLENHKKELTKTIEELENDIKHPTIIRKIRYRYYIRLSNGKIHDLETYNEKKALKIAEKNFGKYSLSNFYSIFTKSEIQ